MEKLELTQTSSTGEMAKHREVAIGKDGHQGFTIMEGDTDKSTYKT